VVVYVISSWTFNPGPPGPGTIVVPGAHTPEEFFQIVNLDRNVVLFDANTRANMEVEPLGPDTLLTLTEPTGGQHPDDHLQIVLYDTYAGGGGGPTSNVAVTNWPASQTVNGNVGVNNFPTTYPVTGTFWQATQPVSGSVSISNFPATTAVTQGTSPWVVSGTVDVGTFTGDVTVSGTVDVGNFPATQTVSGTVDVGNFPATFGVTQGTDPWVISGTVDVGTFTGDVTVSGTVDVGNFPATQTVDGTVDVGNFPATQAVTGTFWPDTQPVSGSVSVSNFPATQAVTGTFWPDTQPVSGSVTVSGNVDVDNFPTTFDIGNFPTTQAVSGTVDVGNFPTTFDIGNFPATQPVSGTVDVGNFPATQAVTGTFWPTTQPVSGDVGVTGTVDVGNFPATQTVDGTVDVGNFPATQMVTGTFWQTVQPVSGTVTANQGTSPWIVSSTGGSTNVASFPSTSTDAFGRLRVSEPFTLFDSSFRYGDNQLWSTATATGGTTTYNTAQGLMDLNVTTASESSVRRQTTKVFPYQPGKSLLVMTTFVCATPKANLDQKVGYFGNDNGYFLEQNGLTTYFVERSAVSGAVTNTRVAQADWNVDPMDGTGPSGITLDISKAQILWMDLEWLGVGTVKMGFVVNGTFYICHKWDHANLVTSTYITTASLPLSCEITNTGATASASTLKQICATVISEGGYALTGLQQSVGTPITAAKTLTTAGTYYPIVSLRLKTTRLDAIAILTAISIQGTGNNNVFRWEVRATGDTTGGSWVSAGANSSVEYNLTGTAYTGGRVLAAGFTSSSNQGTPSINILKEALFTFQLERDAFVPTPYELTIVVAGGSGGTSCFASMDWEEVSR
jgi:hypothetical protein